MEFKNALCEKLKDRLESLRILEDRIIEFNHDFHCGLSSVQGCNEDPAVHILFHNSSTVFSVADKDLYHLFHEKMLDEYDIKRSN
jgi:hypothetical protein